MSRLVALLCLLCGPHPTQAFTARPLEATVISRPRRCARPPFLSMTRKPSADGHEEHGDADGTDAEPQARHWRLERARLDRQHSREVLRRQPRHLPYAGASAFAMTLGLSSQDEWNEWLELGEGRTPYCPSDPETYYRAQGTWISWKAFLTGEL